VRTDQLIRTLRQRAVDESGRFRRETQAAAVAAIKSPRKR
jgi:hypothetical protein